MAALPQGRPPRISASERGPGVGSIGERSQATRPSAQSVPSSPSRSVSANAPTTSPPPPTPTRRTRSDSLRAVRGTASPSDRGCERRPRTSLHGSRYRAPSHLGLRPLLLSTAAWQPLCGDELALADLADRGRGPIELLVGHHRRALEGQIAVDLDPGAAAVVLVLDADGHRPRNSVDPEEEDVQRMPALPGETLLRVIRGPDVERGERLNDPVIVGGEVIGDLGPGTNPDPVGLRDAAVLEQRPGGRLLVRPDTLLEGPAELGMVGLTHEIVALVVEGGVEEEPVVLYLEMLVPLADPALPQGDELLALRLRSHGHGPLFESNRHEMS